MSASILIVDDERNIRLMLRTTLASEGYDVYEAANGHEALDAIRDTSIDLMLLDLNMPEMDGMSMLRQLKLVPPVRRPRVIVLTAYGSVHLAVQATRLGASDFLEKPVVPNDVRLSVACVLEEPNPALAGPEINYMETLRRVRKELFQGDLGQAEALLMRAADQADDDPSYFNLLGVVYETEGRRHLAKRCYQRALAVDREHLAAMKNLQRINEIEAGRQKPLQVSAADRQALLAAVGANAPPAEV